jgi:protein-S-isoprenylcysteine O-methyltransferase Ste14
MQPILYSRGLEFTWVFWVAFALWVIPELFASKAKRSPDASKASDKGSLNLIAVLWIVGIALGLSLARFAPQAAIGMARLQLFFIGVGLMLLGAALRWYSIATLGRFFTFDITVQGGQRLVEAGPYRYVRHPSYTGALLSLLGFGLALENWASVAVSAGSLGIAYCYRIPVEESMLVSAFGETYKEYMKRTWRLVPYLF